MRQNTEGLFANLLFNSTQRALAASKSSLLQLPQQQLKSERNRFTPTEPIPPLLVYRRYSMPQFSHGGVVLVLAYQYAFHVSIINNYLH